jgi:hypothetical protein
LSFHSGMLDLLSTVLCSFSRWDGDQDSLSATLYRARPDVFPASDANPIPSEMPENALATVLNRKRRSLRVSNVE